MSIHMPMNMMIHWFTGRRPMAEQFQPGDRVGVHDTGLARLREVMARITGEPAPPNHHGTVEHVSEGTVYINFDKDGVEGAGNQAPYPEADVYLLRDTDG